MENILRDIKTCIATCTPDELQAHILKWRSQFRNRGISIIALETLLNFFIEPRLIGASPADEAFVTPGTIAGVGELDFDKGFRAMRQEVERLEKENAGMKRQVACWRTRFVAATIVAAASVYAVIILLFIK